jgi:hypothetical protein
MWTPSREDLCIELAGEIGDEDTTLVERAEVKTDRLEDLSARRAQDGDRAQNAVHAIADGIPFGQPILVGHHSERHARKDAIVAQSDIKDAMLKLEAQGTITRAAAQADVEAEALVN